MVLWWSEAFVYRPTEISFLSSHFFLLVKVLDHQPTTSPGRLKAVCASRRQNKSIECLGSAAHVVTKLASAAMYITCIGAQLHG